MESRRIDISGHIYGELSVIDYSHTLEKKAYWNCVCSCGKKVVIHGIHLRSGNTKSCGHNRYLNAAKASKEKNSTHGMEGTKTYKTWRSIKERCTNENHKSYKYYKNIEICEKWLKSFEGFLEDMGVRPNGKTIDRIDNNKGYFKENCKWSTPKEQARNRKSNVFLNIGSESKTIAEWSEIYGISQDTLRYRIKSGWSHEDAITTKVKVRISELRSTNYPIVTKMITVTNRYGESVRVAEWRKV